MEVHVGGRAVVGMMKISRPVIPLRTRKEMDPWLENGLTDCVSPSRGG